MIKKKIAIIGVSGFAKSHLDSIRYYKDNCELIAAYVRNEDRYEPDVNAAKTLGAKIYEDANEMFEAEKGNIDIICIPTGIDSHRDYSVKALKSGYNVICEKPVAGTIDDALQMKKAADTSGKKLCIAFPVIYSPVIQKIKKIRTENQLGKLISCKSYVLWPRSTAYYKRNNWAGKMIFHGKKIFDSPLQNATSHYLNNLLYIAGERADESAIPKDIYAENFRAKNIESADTQFIRIITEKNIKITFIATHACKERIDPIAEYIFENGKIIWEFSDNLGTAKIFKKVDSQYKFIDELDNGDIPVHNLVFKNMFNAVENNVQPLSNINNAYQHTICVNKCFEFGINQIDENFTAEIAVREEMYNPALDISKEKNIVIREIEKTVQKMFELEQSFSETGAKWTNKQ